jgi:hypothetical protein
MVPRIRHTMGSIDIPDLAMNLTSRDVRRTISTHAAVRSSYNDVCVCVCSHACLTWLGDS